MISTWLLETVVLMQLFNDTRSQCRAGGNENSGRSFCIGFIARIPVFLASRIEQDEIM